jgi:hypothetical protein
MSVTWPTTICFMLPVLPSNVATVLSMLLLTLSPEVMAASLICCSCDTGWLMICRVKAKTHCVHEEQSAQNHLLA